MRIPKNQVIPIAWFFSFSLICTFFNLPFHHYSIKKFTITNLSLTGTQEADLNYDLNNDGTNEEFLATVQLKLTK